MNRPDKRLVRRYRCAPVAVELIVITADDRPLHRRARVKQRLLARLVDVSVTGVRVQLLAEPTVPKGGKLTLVWSDHSAEVRIVHSTVEPTSGLVVLGLEFVDMGDEFRQLLYQAVSAARGAAGLQQTWDSAR